MTKKTPLYQTHLDYGGKMVEFAGFMLPIQYSKGIIYEHNTVRNKVGLFDVSHMGEILIQGDSAAAELQKLVTNRVDTIAEKQCRYNLMCTEKGTIIDDLLIYKINDQSFLLVVNASNKDKDYAHIKSNIHKAAVTDLTDDIAQLALQGPYAKNVLSKITDITQIPQKNYRFNYNIAVSGIKCLVSTTGYTGEQGYELYCAASDGMALYQKIMDAGSEFGIEPIGLGARDTLRFESSMPLYGNELSQEIMANEVGLDMFIKLDLDFIGKQALIDNEPKYQRIGLKLIDKGIAREHCDIFDGHNNHIGYTTSGGICPSVGGAFAMARIIIGYEGEFFIDVRGRRLQAKRTDMPFYSKTK